MSWSVVAAAWIVLAAQEPRDDAALDLYFAANALQERGLRELAARQYSEFLGKHPAHGKAPAARLGLAACQLGLGRPADAEPHLAALAADPKTADPARVHLLWGQALAQLDRPAEAEKAFATARDRASDEVRRGAAEAGLLEMKLRARRWDDALALADRLARSREAALADRGVYQGSVARVELGRVEEARKNLARFVEERSESPLLPQARLLLGECLLAAEEFDGALREFRAVRDGRREAHALFLKAESLYRREKWDDAAEAYRACAGQDAALLRLSEVEEKRGKPVEARAALERFLCEHAKSPLRPRAAVELGRLRHEAGDAPGARKALEEAGEDPAARYYLGWVALAEKKEDEADGHFRAVLETKPDPALVADAALQSGILALRRGDARGAEPLLEQATGGKRSDDAFLHLGLARARQEKWAPALEAFGRASGEAALFQRGVCERRLGRPRDAARRFGELLASFPRGAHAEDAALELAELEIEGKEPDAAVRRLTALLSGTVRAATEIRARYRLGTALLAGGDAARAAEAFEGIRDADPETAALAAHQAGEARLLLKEVDRAARHFERAGLEASRLRRAECDARSGRWAESERAYRDFLRERPTSAHAAQAQFGLGWALENQGRPEEALPAYGTAVEAGGRTEIAARSRFQRGECHFALGRYDRAIEELIQVEANYAYPEWSARALLEIGRALQAQEKLGPAAARYREVVERYGKSEAAAAARQLLERMPGR